MQTLGIKLLHPDVQIPAPSTNLSACADIRAFLGSRETVTCYCHDNSRATSAVRTDASGKRYFTLLPGFRAMVPTGLAFDIPAGHSCRVHPRSGLSLKSGIGLACSEGVVDEDYSEETFVLLINLSTVSFNVYCGDRIAQVELVRDVRAKFEIVENLSPKDSSRQGGFGHTGIR